MWGKDTGSGRVGLRRGTRVGSDWKDGPYETESRDFEEDGSSLPDPVVWDGNGESSGRSRVHVVTTTSPGSTPEDPALPRQLLVGGCPSFPT